MTANKLYQLFVVAVAVVLLVAPLNLASAESLGSWASTTNYPLSLSGVSCATVVAEIYCVGGFGGGGNSHNQVYDASLGPSGIGSWSSTSAYPTAIDSASCVNATAGIYCVGGEDDPTTSGRRLLRVGVFVGSRVLVERVRVSQLPRRISCVTYSGYIYCVGGFDNNGDETSSTYYASLSSGLTSWTGTTQYPLAVDSASCVVYGGDIYCVAGETENGSNQNSPISDVYYAPAEPLGDRAVDGGAILPHGPGRPRVRFVLRLRILRRRVRQQPVQQHRHVLTGRSPPPASRRGATGRISRWRSTRARASPTRATSTASQVPRTRRANRDIVNSAYYAAISGATTTTSTTPEFPVTAAIPIMLALGLLVVAGLGRLNPKKNAAWA